MKTFALALFLMLATMPVTAETIMPLASALPAIAVPVIQQTPTGGEPIALTLADRMMNFFSAINADLAFSYGFKTGETRLALLGGVPIKRWNYASIDAAGVFHTEDGINPFSGLSWGGGPGITIGDPDRVVKLAGCYVLQEDQVVLVLTGKKVF